MFSNKFNIGILKHPGYNVGGGIGEAALIGAAFGGGKALVSGEDPLQAALLGGITGGAMSGVTSALLPGAATAGAEVGKTVAAPVVAQGTTAAAPEMLKATLPEIGMANSFNAVTGAPIQAATQAVPSGITSLGEQGMFNSFNTATGAAIPNAGITSVAPTTANQLATATPSAGGLGAGKVTAEQAAQTAAQAQQGIAAAPKDPFVGLKEMINPTPGGTLEKGLDFAIENPYPTAGIGGAAYGALTAKPPEMPKKKEEKSPLAGYDRETFTAYDAPRPNPYPQPQYIDYYKYGNEGGVMQSYAQGGITALAQGGMGGNMGYPQGRLDTTQYATPSQMPTSAQVVNADYEVPTDPYMGSPLKMAEGGIASYAPGGQVYYDDSTGQYYTQSGYPTIGGMLAQPTRNYIDGRGGRGGMGGFGSKMGEMDVDPSVGDYKVAPIENYYQAQYQEQAPIAQYNGPQGGEGFNYTLADSVPLLAATNPGIAQSVASATGMAGGGIAGYNLGGYAAGGNPRLLKGPGDGMSDHIPATIGGRQPARLADGEFVVPADVVSHLGNGSTDAGAKHLYNMMDRVRKARTGRKAQGKQINPHKFMPT
jgi:hypothetical protein